MPNIGPMELVVVLALALIVLGPKRLPETGRSLGKGLRSFKDALSRDDDDHLDLDPPGEQRDGSHSVAVK